MSGKILILQCRSKHFAKEIEFGIEMFILMKWKDVHCSSWVGKYALSSIISCRQVTLLTGDKSTCISMSPDVIDQLHIILDSHDPDVPFDLWSTTQIDQNLMAIKKLKNEYALKAVYDRHHSNLSVAFSVNDLYI